MNFEGFRKADKTPLEESKINSSEYLLKRSSRTYLNTPSEGSTFLTRNTSKAAIVLHPKKRQQKIDLLLLEHQAKIDKDYPPQTAENQTQVITHFLVKNCKKFCKEKNLKESIKKLSWLVFANYHSTETYDLRDALRSQSFLMEPAKLRIKKLYEAFESYTKKENLSTPWSEELTQKFRQILGVKHTHLFLSIYQDACLDKKILSILIWAIGGNSLYVTLECLFHETFFADLAKPVTALSFQEWKKSRLPFLPKVTWQEKKNDALLIEKIHTENVLRSFYVERKVIAEAKVNGVDICSDTPELFFSHLFKEFVKHGFESSQNVLPSLFKQEPTPFDSLLKAASFSAFARFDTLIRTTFPLLASVSCFNIKKDNHEITKSYFIIKNPLHFSVIKEVTYLILFKEKEHWMSSQGTPIGEVRFRCKISWKRKIKKRWEGSLKICHLKFNEKTAPSLVKGAVEAIWQGLPDCRDPKRLKSLPPNLRSQSQTLQPLVPTPPAFPLQ